MGASVLVVEDDAAIRDLLQYTLEQAGFSVVAAASAEHAREKLRNALPAAVLVDWMLPGSSGLALVQRLRQDERTAELPMILVTARDAEVSRLQGLDGGADDYVTKPFSPRELVARVRALLRRRAPEHSDLAFEVGALRLDPVTHQVHLGARRLELRLTEFKLLRFFMAYPGRVFSRTQLLDRVWGDHVFVEERTVDVHIRRLRLALGNEGRDLIATVRGGGYKLAADAMDAAPAAAAIAVPCTADTRPASA